MLPPAPDAIAPSARPETTASGRDRALDFTKGALVVAMIAYHSINYFRYDPGLLRHLHFVPPSFIFIAGFLITRRYVPRARGSDHGTARRLFVRGLKLLGLFTALNLAVYSLFQSSYNRTLDLSAFLNRLDVVFITGEERASVFGVLLPIAYVLLLASLLLRFRRIGPAALPVLAIGTFLLAAVLDAQGRLVFNLDLVSMGLLGTAAGAIPAARLEWMTRHVAVLIAAYLGYSIAVRFQYPTYLMNTCGVGLSVLLFYALGRRNRAGNMLGRGLTLLGNYSLLAYLVQIAVLQVLFRLARHFAIETHAILPPLVLTLLLTFGIIYACDALRRRAAPADRAYRAVFA